MSAKPLAPAPSASRSSQLTVALTLVLGIAASVGFTLRAYHEEERQILRHFQEQANYQLYAARERIRLLEEVMHGLRRSVAGQHYISRQEFASIANDILSRFDGVTSLQWVEVVSRHQRESFEIRAQQEHDLDIRIKSRLEDNVLHPAPDEDYYWAIRFAEPVIPNKLVLGYNVRTAPTAITLEAAAATGEMQVTHSFALAQTGRRGIIFVAPVFDLPPKPNVLKGFVQGVFHVEDIITPSVLPDITSVLSFGVYDLSIDPENPDRIFRTEGNSRLPTVELEAKTLSGERVTAPLIVGGREWEFSAQIDPEWHAAQRTLLPPFIAGGGLLLTLLAAGLVHSINRRHRVVRQQVDERTAALRTSEGELRAILDNSPNAIWIKDLAGRYILVNREFCRLYRKQPKDMIGKFDEEIYPKEQAESMRAADQQALNSDKHLLVEGEYDILGEHLHFYTVKFPVRRTGGEVFGVGGVSTDVTKFKRVETQLAETQKLESLGVLAGGIAHDFNNLLTGVLGNASLIASEFDAQTETGRSARDIETASARAAELCRQMLAYSGRGSFEVQDLNLSEAVEEMVPLLHTSISKHTELILDLDQGLPSVRVDVSQVRQIIMNLVINASEALNNVRGTVHVSTRVRAMESTALHQAVGHPDLESGDYVSFKVTDTGTGIDAQDLSRIFEPFYTTKFTGRGLGLAAVLGIVRGHHGALLVTSTLGVGTTFEMLIPARERQPTIRLKHNEVADSERVELTGKKILLAEDEEVVQNLIDKVLGDAGVILTTVDNGESAIEHLDKSAWDLVILDLTMPRKGGREVLKTLRADHPAIPVIMISGFSNEEAAGKCGDLSADVFLQKPFSANRILEATRGLLAKMSPSA